MEIKAKISSFESFALVDGPGVRSVFFLAGCPYRCLYCHNPETWAKDNYEEITSDEALKKLTRYKPYWKDNGGITISGGEPLLQIDFLIDIFKKAKKEGISTCIDTSGAPFSRNEPFFSKFNELLKVTDLLLLDLKAVDPTLHKEITGKSNENIIDLFNYLNEINFPIWVRYVLLPTYTDKKEILQQSKEFLAQFKNIKKIEVLPYHPFAIPKYQELGIEYKIKHLNMPNEESVKLAKDILEK